MRFVWRVVVVGMVSVAVGSASAWYVVGHAKNAGAAQPEVRLAAGMAGLFAGGAAGLLAGIGLVLSDRKR